MRNLFFAICAAATPRPEQAESPPLSTGGDDREFTW